MPRALRPIFDPLPEPPAPDPADYNEFAALAAELLPADEAPLDQAGLDLAAVATASDDGARAMDALGLDVAAGAEDLEDMRRELEAEDLTGIIQTADDADAEVQQAATNLGIELPAELPKTEPIEPGPSPITPPVGEQGPGGVLGSMPIPPQLGPQTPDVTPGGWPPSPTGPNY